MLKRVLSFVLFVLVILNMAFIYYNSSQSANDSDHTSKKLLEDVLELKDTINGNISSAPVDDKNIVNNYAEEGSVFAYYTPNNVSRMNMLLRDIFHLLEFFSLSFWLMTLLFINVNGRNKSYISMFCTSLVCLIYALSDEYHQTFVDGRGAEFADVILDLSGVAIGILLATSFCHIIDNMIFKYK